MFFLSLFFITVSCDISSKNEQNLKEIEVLSPFDSVSFKNQQVIDTVLKYGPIISSTYKKAVCTELIIQIIERFYKLNKIDKNRIRIITNKDIQTLLTSNSPIPKGVCYALVEKGIGVEVNKIQDVKPGDFVQFWTESWGHCGIIKGIDNQKGIMTMYSSFPSTNGYGIQHFKIPEYSFFVRLK